MKNLLILVFLIPILGWTCNNSNQVEADQSTQAEVALTKMYRDECFKEWENKGRTFDKTVSSMPGITKEQAQNLGRIAGIVDDQGYVIDTDVWVKGCVEKKRAINE